MSNVNLVAISGNLCADPELKQISDDFQVCEMRLATNRSKKQQDGSYEDVASYFDLTAFNKFGALCAKKLEKGSAVTVGGRLEQQRWQNEAGENRSKVVVIVDTMDGPDFYKAGGEAAPATQGAAVAGSPEGDDIPF